MYRVNKRYLQPALISNVNELFEKRREQLEDSWAGTFRREFFSETEGHYVYRVKGFAATLAERPVGEDAGVST